jgi:hypothetical protein
MMSGLFSIIVGLTIVAVVEFGVQDAALASTETLNPRVEGVGLNVAKPFVLARTHLLAAGWKPVRIHTNADDDYFGLERKLVGHNFLEFDSCSVDAGSLCDFYYRKAGKCLRVDTIGEQVREMKVLQWMHQCPSGEQMTESRAGTSIEK